LSEPEVFLVDYDSPWKEALDEYLQSFIALFFPAMHAEIDWPRGYETLDKELQQITPDAEDGRRYVDKLVQVWRLTGTSEWVLIHIEVQGQEEAAFAHRMFVYNCRLVERYNKTVVSLAVLADENPNWRPPFSGGNCGAVLRNFVFLSSSCSPKRPGLMNWRRTTIRLPGLCSPISKPWRQNGTMNHAMPGRCGSYGTYLSAD